MNQPKKTNLSNKALKFCQLAGLPVLIPFVRLFAGEEPREQVREILKFVGVPIIASLFFIGAWSLASERIKTESAQLPGPMATWQAARELWQSHVDQKRADRERMAAEREKAIPLMTQALSLESRAAEADQTVREQLLADAAVYRKRAMLAANFRPTSAPTFVDQTFRSIGTVFVGFFIATLIAVPLGILCGMNPIFNAAMTPIIQLFKPVSPLAWLPIASIVIIWWHNGSSAEHALFSRAFLISATTVSLCSLWPTLVNTALGVSNVDKDYLNVAKVLNLSWWQTLTKIVIPASLPLMFAGLRISLGVGWMVLIAADMLAQNPGLGKFIWDMFQNGSSTTYARIAVAVLVIGVVGFVLDRIMICLRNLVSFDSTVPA